MKLETIVGNLKKYNLLEAGTFQHADQLMDERRTTPKTNDGDLRHQWLYSADGHGYFPREDGGVDWAITRENQNPVLRHINDEVNSSYDQLVQTGNFRPDNSEAEEAKNAEDTTIVDMNQLRLTGEQNEWQYLEIRTSDGFINTPEGYQPPNEEESKAMNRLGYTNENLNMLAEAKERIKTTKIFVLNPEYVVEHTAQSESSSIWRASLLGSFDLVSVFGAGSRDVGNNNRLRGVRASEASTEASAGRDAPGNIYSTLQRITENPSDTAKFLDDNIASGLSRIVADYLTNK